MTPMHCRICDRWQLMADNGAMDCGHHVHQRIVDFKNTWRDAMNAVGCQLGDSYFRFEIEDEAEELAAVKIRCGHKVVGFMCDDPEHPFAVAVSYKFR